MDQHSNLHRQFAQHPTTPITLVSSELLDRLNRLLQINAAIDGMGMVGLVRYRQGTQTKVVAATSPRAHLLCGLLNIVWQAKLAYSPSHTQHIEINVNSSCLSWARGTGQTRVVLWRSP